MTQQTPPGWYDDGSGAQRWWDGQAWTEHVAPPVQGQVVAQHVEPTVAATAGVAIGSPQPLLEPSVGAPAWVTPGNAAPRKKRGPLPWVLGGVGALIVVVLVVGAIAVGNLLGGVSNAGGPREAIEKFWNSWQTSNCEQMRAVTTEELRESTGWTTCDAYKSATQQLKVTNVRVNVQQSDVDGDRAVVVSDESWTGDMGHEEHRFTYTLEQSGGGWRIADVEQNE
ncbi:MAG TPA: DUF2510 domain-containing protein [Candidatus Lumbricidophila sp.]|nr:DUF2510 domain-containing protein [Candidatus Lumbricidophila sp.]